MKHANVALFVPHAGCPHQCSFCNQREISGSLSVPGGAEVTALCRTYAAQAREGRLEAELAFFGGSFTAIGPAAMAGLLGAAVPFLREGLFQGIRISTRPDCIDSEILTFLRSYGVTAIELGAQSMSDQVLLKNRRGHTAADVVRASRLIREAGFSLGLQMMTGLYGASMEDDIRTAERLAALFPDTMRIYPTVVLEQTPLADLYRKGLYKPPSLEETTALCARLLGFFEERGIPVIRMGLHAQESMEAARVAGPYHPAFRELCEGRLLRDRLEKALSAFPPGTYDATVSPKTVSKIRGHGGLTVEYLKHLGYNVKVKQSDALRGLDFQIGEV